MRSDLEIWKKIALNRQAEIEELMFFKELVVRIAIIAHHGDLIGEGRERHPTTNLALLGERIARQTTVRDMWGEV